MLFLLSYCMQFLQTYINLLNPRYMGSVIDIVSRSGSKDDLARSVIEMMVFYIISQIQYKFMNNVNKVLNENVNRTMK